MTLQPADAVEQVILPQLRDLGGFDVRRALPSIQRRMVGPFVFLDSFGPAVFRAGEGMDTRPHPHIGLATLTYLIHGEILHRDSERNVQAVRPGDVSLMTAGRGIVHSERSAPQWRAHGGTLLGFQAWLALPSALEERDPGFQRVAAASLPHLTSTGVDARLLAGGLGGEQSPTPIFADTLYADIRLAAGARFKVENDHIERAAYVVDGEIAIAGQSGRFGANQLVVFRPGAEIIIEAPGTARLILLGGEPLDGHRHIVWNFVSSRLERIDQALDDWRAGRFPAVPGETEFIPAPDVRRAASAARAA